MYTVATLIALQCSERDVNGAVSGSFHRIVEITGLGSEGSHVVDFVFIEFISVELPSEYLFSIAVQRGQHANYGLLLLILAAPQE